MSTAPSSSCWPDVLRSAAAALLLFGCGTVALAVPPHLYARRDYQSPASARPDDLLLLMGSGLSPDDTVLIEQSTGGDPAPGTATIVSTAGVPQRLVVRLPATLAAGATYRLRVQNPAGEVSNAVSVNDARPLWFSPAEVPMRGEDGLPRRLKIVGRNLNARGAPARVRLSGPIVVEMTVPAVPADDTVGDYARSAPLPDSLPAGRYRVAFARDGGDWVNIDGQDLQVRVPATSLTFSVSDERFGACRADDMRDDTACLRRALDAARAAGGGTVQFGPGVWDLISGDLEVPPGVSLRGRGETSTILRHDPAADSEPQALLVLLGDNTVSDLAFREIRHFGPGDARRPVLQLGATYRNVAVRASRIVVTRNLFERTNGALVDAGASLDQVIITFNRIGDYRRGIDLGGNPFNVGTRFTLTDSVIAHNRFSPGSYLDLKADQGAMASELGAAMRVDFSDNVADGADRQFLDGPDDAPGWRAAFFWHLLDNQEMLLISSNVASCTGDKNGDGEAIALDNNVNSVAFTETRPVLRAGPHTARVRGTLKTTQSERQVDPDRFYRGHWLRVDAGPGLGQARRIVAYHRIPGTGDYEFEVAPDFDIAPTEGESSVSVTREFWQTLIVGNTIDHRTPACQKSNRTRPKGGLIALWAQMSDSVVAGNRQYDTDGILLQQAYGADDPACRDCVALTNMPSFVDIVDNLVDGEYDWNSACSLSGITASYAASPSRGSPPLLSVGVSIAHNRLRHADGLHGGAIDVLPTWHVGPPGYFGPLVSQLLIQHNEIQAVDGTAPRPQCGYVQQGRYGIHLQGARSLADTVLYDNRCPGTATGLLDAASRTTRLCPTEARDTCECHIVPASAAPRADASPPETPAPAP